MKKCLIHLDCKASVRIKGNPICYECWNEATPEERKWFEKAIQLYNQGLITKTDFEDKLFTIGYHEIDPTVPVHI